MKAERLTGWRWLIGATALAIGAWLLFSSVLLWDLHADRPDDVARSFVDAIKDGDYTLAASFWEPNGIRNVEANTGLSFRNFCESHFASNRYVLGAPVRGKIGYFAVSFSGEREGRQASYVLYLKRSGGRWRLVEERISPARSP